MATTKLTLLDIAKRSNNDAYVGLVESLTQSNKLLENIPVRTIVGNNIKVKRRRSLPTTSRRALDAGVAPTKSVIDNVLYETKIYESRAFVEQAVAMLAPEGINALRDEEATAHLAAMGNMLNSDFFYGAGSTNPLQVDGLATILPTTAVSTVQTGTGATGVSTSLYFVSFRDATSPQGRRKGVELLQTAGFELKAEDMGLVKNLDDGGTNYIWGYETRIWTMAGLAVYDTQSVGRYRGLTSAIAPTAAGIDAILTAMLPFQCDAIYANRTGLNLIKGLKSTITYYPADTELKVAPASYDGIPIYFDENITDTEVLA